MQIFNIVEELEKERKKNKELEEENEELKSKLKATNKVLNDMDDIAGEYEERIDKAIEYIEKLVIDNENVFYIKNSVMCVPEVAINELYNILKGDNK